MFLAESLAFPSFVHHSKPLPQRCQPAVSVHSSRFSASSPRWKFQKSIRLASDSKLLQYVKSVCLCWKLWSRGFSLHGHSVFQIKFVPRYVWSGRLPGTITLRGNFPEFNRFLLNIRSFRQRDWYRRQEISCGCSSIVVVGEDCRSQRFALGGRRASEGPGGVFINHP